MKQFYNEELELSSLSCLLKNGSLFPIVEDILSKKSYANNQFAIIFESIKSLYSNETLPDIVTVSADLERRGFLDALNIGGKRGRDALEYVYSKDINVDNLESYANQINQDYASRQLLSTFETAIKKMKDGRQLPIEVSSYVDIEMGKINMITGNTNGVKKVESVAEEAIKGFIEASSNRHLYISTGIKAWDDFTNGLYPQRLYIVSARSNDGKSTLVQNILYNLSVDSDVKTMLITLESSAVDIFNKLVQRVTGIPSLRIEKGNLTKEELIEYKEAAKKIKQSNILFDDSSEMILAVLRSKIRKAVTEGVKVIIVDQLENILLGGGGDTQPEYIKLNYIAYRVKAFARESNIPIILVHQMNRSVESGQNRGKDQDPQLTDLASAGEKPADAVLMIRHKKEGQVPVQTFFHWVKNRQGMKGRREVKFDGKNALFDDIPESQNQPLFIQEEEQGELI